MFSPVVLVSSLMAEIFLSYSHKDGPSKDRLSRELRQAGFTVWTDDGLEAGTPSWQQAIEQQIEQATCLVVILSPFAKTSKWVRNELNYGKLCDKRVFPVLVSGDARTALPLPLVDTQFVDLRQEYGRGLKRLQKAIGHCINHASTPDTVPPARPDSSATAPAREGAKAPQSPPESLAITIPRALRQLQKNPKLTLRVAGITIRYFWGIAFGRPQIPPENDPSGDYIGSIYLEPDSSAARQLAREDWREAGTSTLAGRIRLKKRWRAAADPTLTHITKDLIVATKICGFPPDQVKIWVGKIKS